MTTMVMEEWICGGLFSFLVLHCIKFIWRHAYY